MPRTRIKICGLTRVEDIAAVVAAGADAIGFVFYPKSPRYVTPEQAAALIAAMPPYVTTVGLFVNASVEDVRATRAVGASISAAISWRRDAGTQRRARLGRQYAVYASVPRQT